MTETRAASSYYPFRFFVAGLMLVVLVGNGRELLVDMETTRAVLFTLLMAPHVALHWYVDRFRGSRACWAYLVAQGLLALALAPFLAGVGYVLALYAALVGEALGFMPSRVVGLLAAAVMWGFSLIAAGVVDGNLEVADLAIQTAPTLIFVGLAVFLYRGQVVERERAQELAHELGRANRRLEEYALEVEELTITAERRRMARELHDTLAQGLAALVLRLEAASDHLRSGSTERAEVILVESMERARATLVESRAAIDDLRASAVSLGSLAGRVSEMAKAWAQRSGIETDVVFEGLLRSEAPADAISSQAEGIVFEALSNVERHAQATHVVVRLQADTARLRVSVEDDGTGFDATAAPPTGRYGLIGMRERAELGGGTLEIGARPGGGTIVSADLPLAGADAAQGARDE